MATNLVSLVMQFLTPDMVGRIANGFGLNPNMVQSAIAAGVPGLLAGFSGVAATPDGAQKLADAAKQETGTLRNFGDLLGAGPQSPVIERGSQMLSSLLGTGDRAALTNAIGQYTGIGQGSAGSLLGMLAPLVMGAMAHAQGSAGLDANGMANLLAGQKDNIAAALPSGFGNLLSGTGLLASLGGATRSAATMGTQTARGAGSAYDGAVQRGAPLKWLYWLIPAAAIAGLVLFLFNAPTEQPTQQAANTAPNVTVNGRDVGKQVADNVADLHSTLRGVADIDSARAALPKLQDVNGQIGQVNVLIMQLTPEQRRSIAEIVNPTMPTFNQLCEKALAVPGATEVLKPTIDDLKVKLTRLTV